MNRLSQVETWDRIHGQRSSAQRGRPAHGLAEYLLQRIRGARYPGSVNTYTDRILWDRIYAACLPRGPGLKALEVGSAPGEHLIALHRRFGYIPYGVEYSEVGVRQNRDLFAEEGINPGNVIHSDFFDPRFHEEFHEFFDVVISRGFIEHFDAPESVVARHVNLVKRGGILVMSIPNLAGWNRCLARFFSPSFAATHNLAIMRPGPFRRIFRRPDLTEIYCDYLGIFDFDLFWAERGTWAEGARKCAKAVQLALNVLFRLFCRSGGITHPAFSPHLLYIGRKAT